MSINEIQDEIIEEFSDFEDWMDRYQLLIDLGSDQPPLDEKYKNEQNLIDGCQSRVWLQADLIDGRIHFQAESDALIVKGIVALLVRVLTIIHLRRLWTPTSISSKKLACASTSPPLVATAYWPCSNR